MNVLMAFDSNYCKPAMVTMHSLLCNNPCEIRFYIIYSSLSAEEKERLQELAADSDGGDGAFIKIEAKVFYVRCMSFGNRRNDAPALSVADFVNGSI